ncbi:MAG: ribonuclease HII [Bacteroidales bacterium]|nr:MAG: ribonuclease HII [Bacteroidales bacterium]
MLKPYYKQNTIEAGCDEAGRGCLAGPVFAASVVLPSDFRDSNLNDSKVLSHKQRLSLRTIIIANAIDYSVQQISNEEIDRINILNASILGMHKAVDSLRKVKPELLLIDGNRFKQYPSIAHQCIVKGDSLYMSIAAASVLAKTYRDEFMEELHIEFPQYGWIKNKGYPTKQHRMAIQEFGISPYHRLSYRLIDSQLKIF